MTTPNYDDILNALDRQAKVLKDEARVLLKAKDCDATYLFEDARLLREAMEIVRKAQKTKAILREKTNEIDRLMHVLADIARYSPDVCDAVDNDGALYQSAGMADLLELAREWQRGE